VAVGVVAGRSALRLECPFARTGIERGCWDRQVALDLASSRGIEFDVYCANPAPVSYFSLYFQSGEGWYHASFFPESTNRWETVSLDKTAFSVEGNPAGWGEIRAIRLSAWRGLDADTEFYWGGLRQTGALGADALVAVVRPEGGTAAGARGRRSADPFAERIVRWLHGLGVGCAVLGEADLTEARIKSALVVVLPHNPALPERGAAVLDRYAAAGGKLLIFYSVPEALRARLGVQNGRHVREERPGSFAAIRRRAEGFPGLPESVSQRSWNLNAFEPVPGVARVWADWVDDQGQPSGHAALLGSAHGLLMTHVLLEDDPENQERLLLAMLGHLAPKVWEQALAAQLRKAGRIGDSTGFEESIAMIAAEAKGPRARPAIDAALAAHGAATSHAAAGRFPEALDAARTAQRQLTEAWCRAQSAPTHEFRGFWCHNAFGVEGMDWETAIGRLAENGFNAILPNLLWGGVAYYPSRVLPVSPEVSRRGDQVALCLAACRKRGVQIHVWKVNWNLGHAAARETLERLRGEHRLQVSVDGREEPWLCPSHPLNQKLEVESMVEVARLYDVDGLHFDYIRFPDADHCFCEGCRQRFEAVTKSPVASWPDDVRRNGPRRDAWLGWRRDLISDVVRAVSEGARRVRPRIKISAAVFPDWPRDRDTIGQDWKLWCERGWLDFVCPMDYTSSHRHFENRVVRQIEWAGPVPCYPGIGASASAPPLGVLGVIEQIRITRRHDRRGFVIFNYGVREARDLVPPLGLGITRDPSAPLIQRHPVPVDADREQDHQEE